LPTPSSTRKHTRGRLVGVAFDAEGDPLINDDVANVVWWVRAVTRAAD